jgi:hypothetical protein
MVRQRHLPWQRYLSATDPAGVNYHFGRAAWHSYAMASGQAGMRCLDESQRVVYDGRPDIIGPRAADTIQVGGPLVSGEEG